MPEEFGPYLLEEEIGHGGMGVVYRAYDTRRDRQVALKRLPRELSADATFQARFRRESRLAARLSEPHIIPIHDFGEIDGVLFLDMRLVAGADLGSLIAAGKLAPALAVDIIGQVASALTSAHEAGLVHRDVKPSNVLVTGLGDDQASAFAYLVDFGIARGAPGSEGTAVTTNTETVGTLSYMAPERISGGSGDHRSDIYSLACMLYECLTGRAPFVGESFQVMYAHVNTAPPLPSSARAALPPAIDAVIARGMAKDPDARLDSARQVAAAARSALTTRPALPVPPVSAPPGVLAPPDSGQSEPWAATAAFQRPAPPPFPPPAARAPDRPGGSPAHPSGPLPLPPPPTRKRKRTLLVVLISALALVAAGLSVTLALWDGSSPSPPPASTPAPRTNDFPRTSQAPATAAAHWSDFSDFTDLVGRSDGDTSAAFKHGYCALHGSDGTPGMVDRVECTAIAKSPVTYSVARFGNAAALSRYLGQLVSAKGYQVGYWDLPKINKADRGRLYASPLTASFVDVTSSICALPTYVVQFYVAPGSNLSVQDVEKDYWAKSQFPDTIPAPCK